MIINIDYNSTFQTAILTAEDKNEWQWASLLRNLYDSVPGISQDENTIYIPVSKFVAIRYSIADFAANHNTKITLSNTIRAFLKTANEQSYSSALKKEALSPEEIKTRLIEIGFKRNLTNNQVNNLCKLGPLPAGATFSVPGAGKTTEALAYYFLNAEEDDKLLIVAPKNAFGAWDEQLEACVEREDYQFVRLRGGEQRIEMLLREAPKFSIITYQQYPRVKDIIQQFLEKNNVFMLLDESHRIKSGRTGISADSILAASYLPKRKLIMTGTPMPQSIKDIIPQFSFLYPDRSINEDIAIELIKPIYVRTTSGQLDIPDVEHRLITLKMDTLQAQVYQSIKSETKRQLIPLISDLSRISLREINKKIIKIMQFVSNPALLSKDIEYIFDDRIGSLLLQGNGPKVAYVCHRARELASQGKKVIIWSQFVENVELITERLKDIGADFIHGGVDAGDEDENDTREWKIREFHGNPNKMILVANPAAASEGISLHKVCQYAIYLDRSFNAAHYLQSEDRIHRLGLRRDQTPIVEIVECEDTIDQVIRQRLELKVNTMANALNDPSLDIGTVRYDVEFESEVDDITNDDISAIMKYFGESQL